MNREIKFRSFIRELNLMIDDVDVYASGMIGIDTHDLKLPDNHYLDFDDSCIRKVNHDENGIDYHVMNFLQGEGYIWFEKGFELMQFAGLTDKNGKDIYEGDVLNMWQQHHEKEMDMFWNHDVICEHGSFGYKDDTGLFHSFATHDDISKPQIHDAEIIGNTFQNPELIP